MAQRLLNVRVRPPRVTVLIQKDASDAELLLAFEFFSKLWGGRFAQLIPVEPKSSDPLTAFRLSSSRPEYVYGLGVDTTTWSKVAHDTCQPRLFDNLSQDYVREIKRASPRNKDYHLVDHALIHLFQTRDKVKTHKQTLRLISPTIGSLYSAYCAAMFGIHHEKLRKDLFDLDDSFGGPGAAEFVGLATEYVKGWQQSWLDVTGHELNINAFGGPLAPTIVLVGSKVSDLALFWNLRSSTDTTHPAWIIPIPVESASDPKVVDALKEWLLAFLPYGRNPNYCHITSRTVAETVCSEFAGRLRKALSGTAIESVDYEPPHNRLPVIVPFEYEKNWPVEIVGRKLTIIPPKPKAFEGMGSSRAWIVDLLKDVKSGRAVKELQLPPGPVAFELLNCPCPPGFEHSAIVRTGDGTDSINLRCSGSKEIVNVYLPSAREVLEETLREYGIEPIHDEKRSSYHPVIKRFGGLYLAAKDFSGQSGDILASLVDDTKTLDQIKSSCKLGGKDVAGETYLQRIEPMLSRESERMKRIARRRFHEHSRSSVPEDLRPRTLLEHWADRRIISRRWKVGPCGKCHQQYFMPSLNIQRRVVCTNCGNRISLPSSVPIGYTLDRAVAHAIQEGIIPVVQTGRFLRGMTNRGFLWLPGVKFKIGETPGDLDVLACCDGHLVFCECKNLDATATDAKVWDEVVAQFLETARIAKMCNGSIAVLASRSSEYPQVVQDRLKDELGTTIPYLLLNRDDLDKGFRPIKEDKFTRHLALYDILPIPFPEAPRDRSGKPRTINMGWGVYTS